MSPPRHLICVLKLGSKNAIGDNVKSLAKFKVDHIHHPLLVYPSSYAIMKGYEIGQVQLPLGESMLTDKPFFLNMLQLLPRTRCYITFPVMEVRLSSL